jgi:opacity protein-like surface antigen
MKKLLVLILAAVMVSGPLFAQDVVRPVIKSGAKSLNFTFGGFGTFGLTGAGVSGGISMSWFMSNDAALRIGLQAAVNNTKTPYNDLTPNGTNPGSDGTTSATQLGLGVDYLMYMNGMTARVKPFWGLGVDVISNSSDVKPSLPNTAPNGSVTETKNGGATDGLTFGLGGILGAEFFLYSEMSLSAEYKLNFFSVTSRSDRVVSSKALPDVTTKQGSATQILGFGSGGATLHIYF